MFTVNPAQLLGLDRGTLVVGAPADVTLIDPDLRMDGRRDEVRDRVAATRRSTAGNCKGRAVRTIVGGKTVWSY